jgi:linoleate 9S-lipoxygenase
VQQIYVPRDEAFGHLKMSDFLGYSIKAIAKGIVPAVRTYVDTTPKEFDSFQDIIRSLYEGGLQLPNIPALEEMRRLFPLQLIKDLLPKAATTCSSYPCRRSSKVFTRTTSLKVKTGEVVNEPD